MDIGEHKLRDPCQRTARTNVNRSCRSYKNMGKTPLIFYNKSAWITTTHIIKRLFVSVFKSESGNVLMHGAVTHRQQITTHPSSWLVAVPSHQTRYAELLFTAFTSG